MTSALFAFVAFAFLMLSPLAEGQAGEQAGAVQEISWEDLRPDLPPIADPFEGLGNEEMMQLSLIAEVRRQIRLGFLDAEDPNIQYAFDTEADLKETGLPVEDLLAAEYAFQEAITHRNAMLVDRLDGVEIRMSGFAIPLETNTAGVTELLLVPYLGACVHVPAPPANQLVIVSLDQPYKIDELFTPIWVTGVLSTAPEAREMFLVDGVTTIETGYALSAGLALPFVLE